MKLIFLIILFSLSFAISAETKIVDHLQLNTGLRLEVVEAEDLKARVMGFNLGLIADDKLSDSTDLFFDISGTFETGSNESVGNIAEYEPLETIILNNAGLLYSTRDFFSLKVGALDQGEFYSPLLIGNTAFAAIEEKIKFGSMYIKLQQAIPSNNKLTKRVGTVDDATPYFGMEVLGFQVGKETFLKIEAGRFLYRDLSSTTANISKEMGNSVTGLKEAAEYNYEFEGTNTMVQFQHSFASGLITSFWGEYLFNDKAPNGRNKGQLINLGLGNKVYMVHAESFRNESDSSPSFYNSKYYGHNNMQGQSAKFSFNQKDYSFDMSFTRASVIEQTFVQADIDIITINLVRLYEI
jgi:hypothetical protein